MDSNNYYVYEYIRLDTNEPFYVGKGKGNRWRRLDREYNLHFTHIINKFPIAVNILHDNLDEQTAFDFEVWYIREYRDIIGYDMCNINDGGEGQSLCGEKNGRYGKGYLIEGKNNPNYGNGDKIREKNNPMYGKNYRDYMTEEALKEHDRKLSGENSASAKAVVCLTTEKIFNTLREAGEFYGCNADGISKCCKGKIKFSGKLLDETPLVWVFLEDYKKMSNSEKQEKVKFANTPKNMPKGKDNKSSRCVICVTTGKIFETIKEASEYYNCSKSHISSCCRGKRKTCGKLEDGTPLVWKYSEYHLKEGDDTNE